ncbi:hypothetical protein EBS43_01430 [bacterium]|jgi:hypothetical protein|nr:hypothetical protein [bacterium]
MSATRDKSQKIKLVVSNGNILNHEGSSIIEDQLEQFSINELQIKAHQSHVIKADDLRKHHVHSYSHPEFSKKITNKPAYIQNSKDQSNSPKNTLEGLKQNLKTLNELHARLRFMLKELEEIVVEK